VHQPLVPVEPEVVRGDAVGREGRPPLARVVALRRFELEHVGAVVAEDLAAQRAAEHAGGVDDSDSIQRRHGQSAFAPDALTTSFHFADSVRMYAAS